MPRERGDESRRWIRSLWHSSYSEGCPAFTVTARVRSTNHEDATEDDQCTANRVQQPRRWRDGGNREQLGSRSCSAMEDRCGHRGATVVQLVIALLLPPRRDQSRAEPQEDRQ